MWKRLLKSASIRKEAYKIRAGVLIWLRDAAKPRMRHLNTPALFIWSISIRRFLLILGICCEASLICR